MFPSSSILLLPAGLLEIVHESECHGAALVDGVGSDALLLRVGRTQESEIVQSLDITAFRDHRPLDGEESARERER